MGSYVLKRVLLAIFSLFIIITITFFAMHAVPGGPFEKEKAPSPEVKKMLNERFNLDKPVGEQFLIYLRNIIFKGDFGISLKTGREIRDIIHESFAVSGKIGLGAVITALIFGLLFGIIAAMARNTWLDRLIIFFTTLLVSVPSFVLATLLLLTFSQYLDWFPVWSPENPNLVLPIASLAMYPMAYITRLTKSSLLDVLNQDYIRTARAKGVAKAVVVGKHALRNGILPVITYMGPLTASTLTGSLVIEKVFTVGGLGKQFVNAIDKSDYSVIMAMTIFLAFLMVTMNLISDLCYKVVDPRIQFD